MTNQVLDKIKAISIHAPHAYAICMGIKSHEYRNSSTKRRGWVLIHTSSSSASDSCFEDYGIDPKIALRSAIIGAAKIADCEPMMDDQGWEGYGYAIELCLLFDKPIVGVKGCQSVFWGHCNNKSKIRAFKDALEELDNYEVDIEL